MFIKPLQIPFKLEVLDALINRLKSDNPKFTSVTRDRLRRNAGYNGEKVVAYLLKTIDEDHYTIFHDLRLNIGDIFFQIDFLLLTTRFSLIIETKNFAGTLLFDRHGQFIRTINDQSEGFSDPIAQAQFHQRYLRKWMAIHHLPPLTVDYVVIISKPSTIIKIESTDPEVKTRVLPAAKLPNYIFRLDQISQKEHIDLKTQRKLTKLLTKEHSPEYPDIVKDYNLSEKEILPGVQCPECSTLPMISLKSHWECPACHVNSRDAHIQAVHDYFLLYGPRITNRQFRSFLQISSPQKARRLLISMNLPHSGDKKGRIYYPLT